METNKMATVSPAPPLHHLNGVTGQEESPGGRWSWGERDQRIAAAWIRAPQWSIVNWAPCVKATERLVCTAAAICHNCP